MLFLVWINAVNRIKCCKKRSPSVLLQSAASKLKLRVCTCADEAGKLWNADGAARRVSPVRGTLTPAAEMSFFSRGKLWCGISRRGGLVVIAPFWLSASENKVFMLCQSHISSLYFSDEASYSFSSIILTSQLDLELQFRVYWCSRLHPYHVFYTTWGQTVEQSAEWDRIQSFILLMSKIKAVVFSLCFYPT